MKSLKRRALNLLIALDQFLFCLITLGAGHPDETLSAAAWRWETEGRRIGKVLRPLIDRLFWFDPSHCAGAFMAERRKDQLHKAYRS